MKNYVQKGEDITFANTSGSAIASGDVVIQGKIIGVAKTNIAATTGVGVVSIKGVFNLALVASLAITAGDEVFWNASSKWVTKTVTDTPLGVAVSTQLSNDATVNVLINVGAVSTMAVAADVAALTDSTGGTPSSTLAAITAGSSYAQADAVATKNAIASLNASVSAILTSLKAAGHMA